jgi:hypothetical protein
MLSSLWNEVLMAMKMEAEIFSETLAHGYDYAVTQFQRLPFLFLIYLSKLSRVQIL